MVYVAKIKQCRHVDDNQVNQIFKADETESYYQGQALTLDETYGVVKPVSAASDVVFGICEEDHESSEYDFNVHVRQPRLGDTYTIETDFALDQAHIGQYFGIIPDTDDDSDPTGGYIISTDGTSKQFKLVEIYGDYVGEFEFNRANAEAEAAQATANAAAAISEWTAAPSTAPAKVGDIYVDKTNGKVYIAKWKSSSSDWLVLN